MYCGNTGLYTADSPNWLHTSGVFGGSTVENNLFYKFTANATSIQFKLCSTNCNAPSGFKGTQLLIFKGTCNNLGSCTKIFYIPQLYAGAGNLSVQTGGGAGYTVIPPYNGSLGKPKEVSGCTEIKVTGLTIGTTYYFMLDGFEGSQCDYTIQFSSGIVLPVELFSISGLANDYGNEIKWSTEVEPNNDYFELISTTNGEDMEIIAKIKGNTNSNSIKNYSYIDRNPKSNESYYILRQVDLDGRYNYLATLNINRDIDGIDVFPNPVTDLLRISLKSKYKQSYSIVMNDISGVKIDLPNNILELENGINNFEINTENLSKGIYFIKIIDEKGNVMKKQKLLKN